MLPDEVLKEIEMGHGDELVVGWCARIAELATRLEREACVKVLREKETASKAEWNEYLKTVKPYDPITNPNPAGATDYSFVWAVAAEAIEARGRKA